MRNLGVNLEALSTEWLYPTQLKWLLPRTNPFKMIEGAPTLPRGRTMTNRKRFALALIAASLLALIPSGESRAANPGDKNNAVYVCACLGNRSCSCMTEAKMEGPCACGTQGGPPLKAVPKDSDWAKENRDALAK